MKIVDIEQQTPEWFKLREKKLTASNAATIAANGKGLETYTTKLMQEYYSNAEPERFSNEHTERGNELEASARFMYELEAGEVTEVGFVIHSEYVGCSPDGLVGDDGMVEIKCPADKEYFRRLLGGKIKSEYIAQMQMQMMICERSWCDHVVYNPNYDQKIIVDRIKADPKMWEKLDAGFDSGIKQMKDIENQMGKL